MKNYYIKLKHLSQIAQPNFVPRDLIKLVLGWKTTNVIKEFIFRKKIIKAFDIILAARQLKTDEIEMTDCQIKLPSMIDAITFKAMMELQSMMTSDDDSVGIENVIAKIIAIATFSANHEQDFDSSCIEFQHFEIDILDSDLEQMLGLYNWILKQLDQSNKDWSNRFLSVELVDEDYQKSGGSRMNQFNVITTLKNICSDFNVTFDQAWQMQYAITQTNSYSKATYNHIQDQMRQLKEAKMKTQRNLR
ncbi:hypothetical protein Phi13:1_gp010 [Cellulophaga phage phi13:1]|uniref:Uncharacterized protein n=1 Tax=Cellulophaga phage phi13:1 TaxID=1327992 RepID=S0A0Y4_9CAUD|nr:hypothetical protein Phi13:1_gp010 [Cellulophaga phage phi13:1]